MARPFSKRNNLYTHQSATNKVPWSREEKIDLALIMTGGMVTIVSMGVLLAGIAVVGG